MSGTTYEERAFNAENEVERQRRELAEVRELLRECKAVMVRRNIAYPGDIDAFLLTADQPTGVK